MSFEENKQDNELEDISFVQETDKSYNERKVRRNKKKADKLRNSDFIKKIKDKANQKGFVGLIFRGLDFIFEKLIFCYEYYLSNKNKCQRIGAVVIAALVLVIVLAILGATGSVSSKRVVKLAEQNDFSYDTDEKLNNLIKQYYTAIIAADVDTLNAILDDGVQISKEDLEQSLIEGYDSIVVFTAPGLKDNEYVVYVYWEAKLLNIETKAPGLEGMYVIYDKNSDSYKIKTNLDEDKNVRQYFNLLSQKGEIKDLITETNKKFDEAIKSDANLKLVYDVITESNETSETNNDTNETEATTEASTEGETKATEETTKSE